MKKNLNLEINLPVNMVKAIYRDADLPEHAGNPLIEALPPFHQAADMMESFGRYPNISDTDRLLPASMRMLAVSRLNNYLEPLPPHFNVIEKIGLIIRAGYSYRNPKDEEYQKALTEFYRQVMQDGKIIPIGASTPSTAPSFAIFGNSGVGKSTVVERTLSFLPQVLLHEEHKFAQVVWMKLDCPPDGSLKQLLAAILANFDNLLGTSDKNILNKQVTVDALILDVAKIAAKYHLGVLIIDEIQNLLDASGVAPAIMLNFFLTFANVVKIPLVTVGTPFALHLVESRFRTARRIGDHGTYMWNRLSFGQEWSFFVDGLWRYQYTAHPVPLGKELSELMYDKTLGIHALVVRLFQMSQLRAIRDGNEELTIKLIAEVAFDRFKLVAPILELYSGKGGKKGDKKAGKLVEDFFDDCLKTLENEVENEANLFFLQEKARANNQNAVESLRAVSALIALGYEEDPVQKIVTGLFEAHPDMTSASVVRAFLESMTGNTRINEPEGESLKEIVQKGEASGISAHSALKAVGVIRSPQQE